jgi:hypothetical protein
MTIDQQSWRGFITLRQVTVALQQSSFVGCDDEKTTHNNYNISNNKKLLELK